MLDECCKCWARNVFENQIKCLWVIERGDEAGNKGIPIQICEDGAFSVFISWALEQNSAVSLKLNRTLTPCTSCSLGTVLPMTLIANSGLSFLFVRAKQTEPLPPAPISKSINHMRCLALEYTPSTFIHRISFNLRRYRRTVTGFGRYLGTFNHCDR